MRGSNKPIDRDQERRTGRQLTLFLGLQGLLFGFELFQQPVDALHGLLIVN